MSCHVEDVQDGVPTGATHGLGYAWLVPLIQGVIQGQQQNSAAASDSFTQVQAAIAQERAAQERQDTITRLVTITAVVGILGLGSWAVYRLTK